MKLRTVLFVLFLLGSVPLLGTLVYTSVFDTEATAPLTISPTMLGTGIGLIGVAALIGSRSGGLARKLGFALVAIGLLILVFG